MQFAGFAILVVANCYLGGEKSARNVILRNAMVVGCVGNEQMKTLFDAEKNEMITIRKGLRDIDGLLNWHYKPMVYRFVYAQDAKKNFGKNWD